MFNNALDEFRALAESEPRPEDRLDAIKGILRQAAPAIAEFLKQVTGRAVKVHPQITQEGTSRLRLELHQRMLQGDRVPPRFYMRASHHPHTGYVVEAGYCDGWGRVVRTHRFVDLDERDIGNPKAVFSWVDTSQGTNGRRLSWGQVEKLAEEMLRAEFETTPSDIERASSRLTRPSPVQVHPDVLRLMGFGDDYTTAIEAEEPEPPDEMQEGFQPFRSVDSWFVHCAGAMLEKGAPLSKASFVCRKMGQKHGYYSSGMKLTEKGKAKGIEKLKQPNHDQRKKAYFDAVKAHQAANEGTDAAVGPRLWWEDKPAHVEAALIQVNTQKLLEISQYWKKAMEQGDNLLEASFKVIEEAEKLSGAHWKGIRKGLISLGNALDRLAKVRDKVYAQAFQKSFPIFRGQVQSWGFPPKWLPGPKTVDSTPGIKSMSDSELIEVIKQYGPSLHQSVRDMLETGASARRILREVAQKGECTKEELEDAVRAGKELHKAVGNVFYKNILGFMKRVRLFLERLKDREMWDSVDHKAFDLMIEAFDVFLGTGEPLEEADAFMQHCVAKLTGKGKSTESAFAICTAAGQKAGYYKAGTKELTAKGREAAARHAGEEEHATKVGEYEAGIDRKKPKAEGLEEAKAPTGLGDHTKWRVTRKSTYSAPGKPKKTFPGVLTFEAPFGTYTIVAWSPRGGRPASLQAHVSFTPEGKGEEPPFFRTSGSIQNVEATLQAMAQRAQLHATLRDKPAHMGAAFRVPKFPKYGEATDPMQACLDEMRFFSSDTPDVILEAHQEVVTNTAPDGPFAAYLVVDTWPEEAVELAKALGPRFEDFNITDPISGMADDRDQQVRIVFRSDPTDSLDEALCKIAGKAAHLVDLRAQGRMVSGGVFAADIESGDAHAEQIPFQQPEAFGDSMRQYRRALEQAVPQ